MTTFILPFQPDQFFQEHQSGRVLIYGPSISGKTRLVQDWLQYLEAKDNKRITFVQSNALGVFHEYEDLISQKNPSWFTEHYQSDYWFFNKWSDDWWSTLNQHPHRHKITVIEETYQPNPPSHSFEGWHFQTCHLDRRQWNKKETQPQVPTITNFDLIVFTKPRNFLLENFYQDIVLNLPQISDDRFKFHWDAFAAFIFARPWRVAVWKIKTGELFYYRPEKNNQ